MLTYSFPHHADIPTSSTAFYIATSSIVADIPTDPTSSIVPTFPETQTGVELIERTEPILTHLMDQFLYHCTYHCHSLLKLVRCFR